MVLWSLERGFGIPLQARQEKKALMFSFFLVSEEKVKFVGHPKSIAFCLKNKLDYLSHKMLNYVQL